MSQVKPPITLESHTVKAGSLAWRWANRRRALGLALPPRPVPPVAVQPFPLQLIQTPSPELPFPMPNKSSKLESYLRLLTEARFRQRQTVWMGGGVGSSCPAHRALPSLFGLLARTACRTGIAPQCLSGMTLSSPLTSTEIPLIHRCHWAPSLDGTTLKPSMS